MASGIKRANALAAITWVLALGAALGAGTGPDIVGVPRNAGQSGMPAGIGASQLPVAGSTRWSGPVTEKLNSVFKRYHRAEVDQRKLFKRVAQFQKGAFALNLGGGQAWDLELERYSIRGPGYAVRLITPNGIETVPPSPEHVFKGTIRGNPASSVRLSMGDGRITGQIDAGNGRIAYIEPLDRFDASLPSSSHAVYYAEDLLPVEDATCGFDHDQDWAAPPSDVPSAPLTSGAACMTMELGLVAENSMLTGYGSVAAVEKRFNDVYLQVDGMYMDTRVGINIKINEIFIEMTATGVFGTRDMSPLLNGLNKWAATGFKNSFDAASIWWYQRSGGVVGLAGLSTICSRTRPGNCVKDFTTTMRSIKIDAAHELGHNWSSPHVNGNTLLMNPGITGVNDQWNDQIINYVVGHKNSRTCLSACAPVAIHPRSEPALPGGLPEIMAAFLNGRYRVQGVLPKGGNLEFLVKRANGAQVQRRARTFLAGGFEEELDLAGLPQSLYFLEVRNGNSLMLRQTVGN